MPRHASTCFIPTTVVRQIDPTKLVGLYDEKKTEHKTPTNYKAVVSEGEWGKTKVHAG